MGPCTSLVHGVQRECGLCFNKLQPATRLHDHILHTLNHMWKALAITCIMCPLHGAHCVHGVTTAHS